MRSHPKHSNSAKVPKRMRFAEGFAGSSLVPAEPADSLEVVTMSMPKMYFFKLDFHNWLSFHLTLLFLTSHA